MAFRMLVQGVEPFEISKESIKSVRFTTDIPLDSNARTKDVGSSLVITGKIIANIDGAMIDNTPRIAAWSKLSAEHKDCYRSVTVQYIAGGTVVRKYIFPNAFVIDYREDYDTTAGNGIFVLNIKQKKDMLNRLIIEGGYGEA